MPQGLSGGNGDPLSVADAFRQALAAERRGDADRAEQLCAAILDVESNHVDALLLLAMVHDKRRRYEKALPLVDRALTIRESADAFALRGTILRALGRDRDALASYDEALTRRADFVDVLYNRGNLLQALERHHEAIASYDRLLSTTPRDVQALHNRGTALLALGLHERALESFGRVLAVRPDYPEALSNRAIALVELKRYDEALTSANRALALRPEYAEALNSRGNALHALGRHAEALGCYSEAFAIRPDATKALGMGNALQGLERHEEALACFDKALAIKGDYVEALNNRGNVLRALERHADALASYARAIALKPSDAEAHWNEGLTRLAVGDYAQGWEKYEWRWRNPKLELPPRHHDKPEWLGTEDIAGKTVLLYPEQGFGDAIQFVRYAPMVAARGAKVVVVCHRKLCELFQTVAGVHAVQTPEQALPSFDFHAALMSLPRAFKTRINSIPEAIPYVSASEARIESWRDRLSAHGAGRKVGLVWAGNPKFPRARAKACPVERLAVLLDTPSCIFFGLQTGDAATDVASLSSGPTPAIDLSRELDTFSDTAGVIAALDLIITIDTAVAHLAGALGKPVWILLPFAADWRWLLDRDDSPWYPTARLFRQSRPGDWDGVIARVAEALVSFGARD